MAIPNHHTDLASKLDKLTERVARIEHKLHLTPPPPEVAPEVSNEQSESDADAPQARPQPDPLAHLIVRDQPHATTELARKAEAFRQHTHAYSEHPPTAPPTAPAQPAAPRDKVEEAIAALRATPTTSPSTPKPPTPSPQQIAPPPPVRTRTPDVPPRNIQPTAPAAPRRSVEIAIGVNWFAWIGAIVLLLAGALFITTAYREGWIASISPVTRCISVAVFGILLLGAGEWALRKISRLAAVGFYGAGLGTLYIDAFATSQWFEILPANYAFILLSIVALLGFALTLRARTLTIGILSVIGGYLAPILLSEIAGSVAGAAVYLTMLLVIALGLSAFMPKPMRPLRYVAVIAHGILAILWTADAVPGDWQIAIVAYTVWWALIIGESVFAALRRQSANGNVVITMLASAWYVIIGCGILATATAATGEWLGGYTGAIALLSAAIAFQFGPGVDVLRQRPKSAMDKLSIALMLQSAVLAIVAIAFQFEGTALAIAWLTMGLAAIELGRRLPSRGMDIFGIVSGALGVLTVTVFSVFTPTNLDTTIAALPGIDIRGWTVLALVTLAILMVAAKRLRAIQPGFWAGMKVTLTATAILGWCVMWTLDAHDIATTWLWLIAAVALIALERFGRRECVYELGIAVLAVTAGRWLLVDAVGARLDPAWDPNAALPFLNWQMALALAIALTAGLASFMARFRPAGLPVALINGNAAVSRRASFITTAVLGFAAFILFALSFDIDRMAMRISFASEAHAWSLPQLRHLMFTMLWAIGAVCVHAFGSSLHKRGGAAALAATTITRTAWVAILALGAKWAIIDTLFLGFITAAAGARLGFATIANIQLASAGVIVLGASVMLHLTKRAASETASDGSAVTALGPFERAIASALPLLISLFMLWALSFEVDRFIGRLEQAGTLFNWPASQVRILALTMLWSAGSAAMAGLGMWRRDNTLITTSSLLAIGAALFWMVVGTFHFRVQAAPTNTTLFLNMQFMAGAMTLVAIIITTHLVRPLATPGSPHRPLIPIALTVIALMGLWLGSFEIDRAFVAASGMLTESQVTARQMCFSIYWSLFAFALIAIGFRSRTAAVRYAGIALFFVTLVKVFLVDLSQVESIYRVASLVAVGLLLVLTSAAYAKLAPKLLRSEAM